MNDESRLFRALIVAEASQQAEALLQRLHAARLPVKGLFSSRTDRLAGLLAEHPFDLLLVRLGGTITAADVAAAYRDCNVHPPMLVVDAPEGSDPVALLDLMAAGAEGLIRDLADGRLERLVEHRVACLRAIDAGASTACSATAIDDLLRGLVEHCGDAAALLDDGAIGYANPALLGLLGYGPGEDLPAARLVDLASGRDAQVLDSRINRALLLESDDNAQEGVRLKHRDGHSIEVGMRLHVMELAGTSRVAVFLRPVDVPPGTRPKTTPGLDAPPSGAAQGADSALGEAKTAVGSETMPDEGLSSDGVRLVLDEAAARVERLLEARGARLLFEPVVSLRGDSQEYYAVSARIPDAAGGQATAGETLSASDIERWVMERAMREQARERRRGRRAACVLRLSADSVQEPGLLIWICDTLREHQLRGSWLAFAVRATDAAAYAEPWQSLSDGLRTVDCRICIDDDEGAEPSAAAIAAMRPDFLRFTPEVVAGLAGNTTLQQRLLARVRMAQREGIRTIVAGVRDARSLALFWDIGIDFVQGNLLQEALTDLDPRR